MVAKQILQINKEAAKKMESFFMIVEFEKCEIYF
jgi:hypothetical protein